MIEAIADRSKVTLPDVTSTAPWRWVIALVAVLSIVLSLLARRDSHAVHWAA